MRRLDRTGVDPLGRMVRRRRGGAHPRAAVATGDAARVDGLLGYASQAAARAQPLPIMRLRPSRDARPLPRVRRGTGRAVNLLSVRRRLFTLLSSLSLILCVAMGALWVR